MGTILTMKGAPELALSVELSNGRTWSSAAKAMAHFRSIRDRYPIDDTKIHDSTDHSDLLALLERYDATHPAEPAKQGSGVSHFLVRTNRVNGGATRGFWVVRTDGSKTDFSFPSAIKGAPKTQDAEFVEGVPRSRCGRYRS